jgi:hypothetical protein
MDPGKGVSPEGPSRSCTDQDSKLNAVTHAGFFTLKENSSNIKKKKEFSSTTYTQLNFWKKFLV